MKRARLGALPASRSYVVAAAVLLVTASVAASKPSGIPPSVISAVVDGDLDAVKQYLADGGDINAFDGNTTLLHTAAIYGHATILQFLLDQGADVNAAGDEGETAIHYAALHGHTNMVRLLAARGATIGDAPTAAAANRVDLLRAFVAKDPDLLTKTWHTWAWNEAHPLLHHAAHHGSAESIAALVALGADAQVLDSNACTPLMIAAARGHAGTVAELLKHDDGINHASKYSRTPLNLAADRGHDGVVRLLLHSGARYDIFTAVARGDLARVQALVRENRDRLEAEVGLETPLMWAAEHNKPEILTWFLEQHANADAHNVWEESALGVAAWKGYTGIVWLLLDADANTEIGAGEDAYGTPLHRACWQGHLDIVRLLLDRGANLHAVDNTGETPICFAASEGHLDVVVHLLERGADPNKGDPLFRAVIEDRIEVATCLLDAGAKVGTSLHLAAERGKLALVKLLLQYPVNPAVKNDSHRTALHEAARCSMSERVGACCQIIDLLLDHGFDVHALGYRGRHAIHLATDVRIIKRLLDRGADVNARTRNKGLTPLHMACLLAQPDRARFLLEHGADPNAADKDGGTPLHGAMRREGERAKAIITLLCEHGATFDVFAQARCGLFENVLPLLKERPDLVTATGEGGQTLLHVASGRGDLDAVKALLAHGAERERPDGWAGWTPLHCAAAGGHDAVVKYLIDQGACVEAPGTYRQGILYTAAMKNHAGVIRLLCAAGANVEAKTSWGYTPLHAAACNGHVGAVKALLDAGADVNGLCKGSTVLDAAVEGGHEDLVRLLLARGADVNGSERTYSIALHCAGSGGQVEMIRILLDAGAPVNRLNERGDTALDWALSNGNHEAVKALRAAGGVTGHQRVGPKRIAALVRQLADESYEVREAAEAALRAIAPDATHLLHEARRRTDDLEARMRLERILRALPQE